MNKYNVLVLNQFNSPQNVAMLERVLVRHFNDAGVANVIHKLMPSFMQHYSRKAANDLMYSTPVAESDIYSQVNCLDDAFLADRIEFIKQNILRADDRDNLTNNNVYVVNDGRVATAESIVRKMPRQVVNDRNSHCVNVVKEGGQSANDRLQSWRYPTRGREIREDVAGDDCTDGNLADTRHETAGRANVYIGDGFQFRGGSGESDQRDCDRFGVEGRRENTNYAVETMLNDPKVQLLNRRTCKYGAYDSMPEANVRLWSDDRGFVDESDPSQMRQYMNRRVFRTWNGAQGDNVADQIAPWQKWIHKRHVDMKDVTSLKGNVERDNHVRGYDMSSLHCRVEQNRRQNQAASVHPFKFEC